MRLVNWRHFYCSFFSLAQIQSESPLWTLKAFTHSASSAILFLPLLDMLPEWNMKGQTNLITTMKHLHPVLCVPLTLAQHHGTSLSLNLCNSMSSRALLAVACWSWTKTVQCFPQNVNIWTTHADIFAACRVHFYFASISCPVMHEASGSCQYGFQTIKTKCCKVPKAC